MVTRAKLRDFTQRASLGLEITSFYRYSLVNLQHYKVYFDFNCSDVQFSYYLVFSLHTFPRRLDPGLAKDASVIISSPTCIVNIIINLLIGRNFTCRRKNSGSGEKLTQNDIKHDSITASESNFK